MKWSRCNSMWPATFGLACCAIEMMAAGAADYDLARFGMEVFRPSPRQADLMIVAGRLSQKMAPVLRQVYDQMVEPKWVISMGVCASTGGMFNNYTIVQGVDEIVPVDVYAPGCPPCPQTLIHAILTLHEKVRTGEITRRRRARTAGARASTSPPKSRAGPSRSDAGADRHPPLMSGRRQPPRRRGVLRSPATIAGLEDVPVGFSRGQEVLYPDARALPRRRRGAARGGLCHLQRSVRRRLPHHPRGRSPEGVGAERFEVVATCSRHERPPSGSPARAGSRGRPDLPDAVLRSTPGPRTWSARPSTCSGSPSPATRT